MGSKNPFQEYEQTGEEKVRQGLAAGLYGKPDCTMYQKASGWLSLLDNNRRDAREKETLSIAEEANNIASDALSFTKRSSRIDRIIAIIAIIIAAIAAKADIKWLISWIVNLLP